MKNEKYSVYATNSIAPIKAPKGKSKDEPKASVLKSKDDLRIKKSR